jgi:fumarate reductase subunit C
LVMVVVVVVIALFHQLLHVKVFSLYTPHAQHISLSRSPVTIVVHYPWQLQTPPLVPNAMKSNTPYACPY